MKLIEGFVLQGGKHCITNSLKQIFDYYDSPLSEAMLFGIRDGLDFTYINLAMAPMVSGRAKVLEFENTLARRLGAAIKVKQGKDSSKIFLKTKEMLDQDQPVLVYADMPFLKYLGLDKNSHFGGHTVVIFGYDDAQGCFYVSERDSSNMPIRTPAGPISRDFHLVPYEEMEMARKSSHRPFPANNKYLAFDFSGYKGVAKDVLTQAIIAACDKMLNPPANLKGVKGIAKFSKEIRKWRKFDREKLKRAGATNYFQIDADGGTGGGIFRSMFGTFLIEASPVLERTVFEAAGHNFLSLSDKWDEIAQKMEQLHETGDPALLDEMSIAISENYEKETALLVKLQEMVH